MNFELHTYEVIDPALYGGGMIAVRTPGKKAPWTCSIISSDMVRNLVVPPVKGDLIVCFWLGTNLIPVGYKL